MSLSLAYDVARSALSAAATATSVVSRNVQNAGDANAARKSADLATAANGGVYVAGISSSINQALFDHVVENSAEFSELQAITTNLERLDQVVGDPELGINAAALIAELQSSLQVAAASPGDETLARIAIARAGDLARGINEAARVVSDVRNDADVAIGEAAVQLESLLAKFELLNNEVVNGTNAGRDVTDANDTRNAVLREISELIGVRATVRGSNDIVLFAANGATLFETVPRQITFSVTAPLAPGQNGSRFSIDGVPFSVDEAGKLSGRIGGLMQVRDSTATTLNRQLDELARGLITVFAEHDQSALPTLPDMPGLFTFNGGFVPPAGTVVDGLAALLRVNANVDPQQGGVATRLRDGGISDPGNPSYIYNATGVAGYSERLMGLQAGLSGSMAFDPAAGLSDTANLRSFASQSAGWLSELRQAQTEKFDDKQVLGQRALASWQDSIGINLDDELTALIALERSYQASSRLINSVNGMFDALLSATG